MAKYIVLYIFVVSWFVIACETALATNTQHSATFILDNIHIVDAERERLIPSQRIVVANGKIIKINDTGQHLDTNDILVIDGGGGYVTAGLIDMHVHMYEKQAFTLALSHGVTHVRIMNGVPAQLEWRDALQKGELIGSTATVSSPIISGYEDTYLHRTVLSVDELQAAVREYHELGYDLIKAYGNLSEEVLAALVQESKKLGIPVAKHGPHASGNMSVNALSSFQSFEHVEDIFQGPLHYQFSTEHLPSVIQQIKQTNVPLTPTLNIYNQLTRLTVEKQSFLDENRSDYISSIIALEANTNQVKRWLNAPEKMAHHNQKTLAFLIEITRHLHQSGVTLMVGSDSGALLSPHGLATHTEMRLLSEAGLTPFEVIAAATINPARALGLDEKMGRIKPQFNADFILTKKSPLDDLSVLQSPDGVVKNGNWYSKSDLQQLREQAIASRSFWAEFKVLFDGL